LKGWGKGGGVLFGVGGVLESRDRREAGPSILFELRTQLTPFPGEMAGRAYRNLPFEILHCTSLSFVDLVLKSAFTASGRSLHFSPSHQIQ